MSFERSNDKMGTVQFQKIWTLPTEEIGISSGVGGSVKPKKIKNE